MPVGKDGLSRTIESIILATLTHFILAASKELINQPPGELYQGEDSLEDRGKDVLGAEARLEGNTGCSCIAPGQGTVEVVAAGKVIKPC
jgi:hypothetical protein